MNQSKTNERRKRKECFIETQTSNNSDQVSSTIAAAPLDGLKNQNEKAQQKSIIHTAQRTQSTQHTTHNKRKLVSCSCSRMPPSYFMVFSSYRFVRLSLVKYMCRFFPIFFFVLLFSAFYSSVDSVVGGSYMQLDIEYSILVFASCYRAVPVTPQRNTNITEWEKKSIKKDQTNKQKITTTPATINNEHRHIKCIDSGKRNREIF